MKNNLDKSLATVRELLANDPSGKLWDVLTALRGPDTPSERSDMPAKERDEAYRARRVRKYKTVEVIRYHAVGHTAPGARRHADDKVILPNDREVWDHFDKHVERAARALGLRVEYE